MRVSALLDDSLRIQFSTSSGSFLPAILPRRDGWRNFCGADRDRTDDLRLAKPALSRLSYGPDKKWWARAELNCRPHAYQACALTT